MENYFDREILALERELSQIKTAAQRSSGVIKTVSKTIQVSVSLVISESRTFCRGYTYYEITTNSDSILQITLDWYHQNVMDEWKIARTSRYILARTVRLNNGKLGIQVVSQGTNWSADQSDDLSRLERGESISITANMTILSTDNFTIRKL